MFGIIENLEEKRNWGRLRNYFLKIVHLEIYLSKRNILIKLNFRFVLIMNSGDCIYDAFQTDLIEWMNDPANSDASFQEFVGATNDFIERCTDAVLELQSWDVDDQKTLLTVIIAQTSDKSQVLNLSACWPNTIVFSKVHFGIHTKGSTTLLRGGKIIKPPDNVSFITNRASSNYTTVGSDGETIHFIGKSTPNCSCSCSTRKSSKKKPSQKSSSSKSCRHKSSDRRHHRSKSRCRGCKKYH